MRAHGLNALNASIARKNPHPIDTQGRPWADALLYAFVNGLLWLIWAFTGHSTGNSVP